MKRLVGRVNADDNELDLSWGHSNPSLCRDPPDGLRAHTHSCSQTICSSFFKKARSLGFFASGWSLALGTIRNLKLNSTAPAACSYTESTLRPTDEHLLEGYAWSRTGRCNQISRMRHEDMWIVTAQGAGPRLRRCVVLFLPL